jgi:hypothetical protein
VVISPIDQGDSDLGVGERARRREAPEPSSDHDDVWSTRHVY